MACRFSVLVLLCVVTSVLTLEKGKFLDMSYGYDENTLAYPSVGFFQLSIGERGPTDDFPWLEYNYMSLPEHIGTHIDAPAHFAKGRMRVDDIPIGRLICAAVRVDISEKAQRDRNYAMTAQDLQDWEEVHGKIPDDCLLFVYTGWGAYYPDRLAYQGTTRNDTYLDEQGESLVHSPGVGPEAATWLVQNRKIVGLGIDAPNLDCGQNEEFMTHRVLMEADIYGIENVANLDKLPNTGAKVYALPMKIIDGSGAPVRIIATLDGESSSGTTMLWATFSVCGVFLVISLMFQ